MARVVVVANQKGGIGKTETVKDLGVALAELAWSASSDSAHRKRVLIIDLDPQNAASRHLGVPYEDATRTLADLLTGKCKLSDAVVTDVAGVPGLDLLPSHPDLKGVETDMANKSGREMYLAEVLEDLSPWGDVLVDGTPHLGLLVINALWMADEVLTPVNMTDEGSLQGVWEMYKTVEQVVDLQRRVAKRLGAPLDESLRVRIRALVRTMVTVDVAERGASRDDRDAVARRTRKGRAEQIMDASLPPLAEELGIPIAKTVIPESKHCRTASTERVPLLKWRPSSPAAVAYRQLARELYGDAAAGVEGVA